MPSRHDDAPIASSETIAAQNSFFMSPSPIKRLAAWRELAPLFNYLGIRSRQEQRYADLMNASNGRIAFGAMT